MCLLASRPCVPARSLSCLQANPRACPPCPQTLNRILDRSHLAANKERPYPESGVGYEVVAQLDGSGLLKGVE